MNDAFIIFWKGQILVSVANIGLARPSEILDWYAEKYAFDRQHLTWAEVHVINYTPQVNNTCKWTNDSSLTNQISAIENGNVIRQ